jgi:CRISPR/Cas system endoribonuclease Cas6 (RAMP superfamily)
MSKDIVSIGNTQFTINNMRSFETQLKPPFTLITGTPIIMRISKKRYQKFNIETKYHYDYAYWRRNILVLQ